MIILSRSKYSSSWMRKFRQGGAMLHCTAQNNFSGTKDIILKLTIIFVAVICTLFQNEIINTFVQIISERHKILVHRWNISRFRFSIQIALHFTVIQSKLNTLHQCECMKINSYHSNYGYSDTRHKYLLPLCNQLV